MQIEVERKQMTLLEQLQRKMNSMDWEVWRVLHDCEEMIANDGSKKAVTAYLQMAVHFYGINRLAVCIKNYGFERIKQFIS